MKTKQEQNGEHKAIVDLADVLKIASEMRQEVEK